MMGRPIGSVIRQKPLGEPCIIRSAPDKRCAKSVEAARPNKDLGADPQFQS